MIPAVVHISTLLRRTLVPHNKIEPFCGTPLQAAVRPVILFSKFKNQKSKFKRFSIFYFLFFTFYFSQAQVTITNLRCEMLQTPLGIDVQQPRLSWQLESKQRNVVQQSYQIIVSSSLQKLQANNGDVWNSGVITSSQSAQVYYAGKALQSATIYY